MTISPHLPTVVPAAAEPGSPATSVLTLEEAATRLLAMLIPLPGATALPVEWVIAQLMRALPVASAADDAAQAPEATPPSRFLTAAEYGRLRHPPRSADWVRRRCAGGKLPGAFRDGGQWVVPRDAESERLRADDADPSHAGMPEPRGARAHSASRRSRRLSQPTQYPRW